VSSEQWAVGSGQWAGWFTPKALDNLAQGNTLGLQEHRTATLKALNNDSMQTSF
jgi:hypothetical protein